ncbi:hypothetical protein [Alkalihalobacillus deserti]|uniref:hypothetical protein n=1 Tax=Alkalihalobacillus deserti TaxID=2879466 RepID=UPI001D134A3C|nr:hypothetical protein [Alkalihalobacillus deserti]
MKNLIALCCCIISIVGLAINVQANNSSYLHQLTIVPLQSTGVIHVDTIQEPNVLEVDHKVSESDVYVECFVNGFHFNQNKVGSLHQENEGHIRLYINDEHVDTLYQPAFIIRDLPKGEYEVKVVIVKNDRSPYDMEETFTITIPQ